jgi:hypothetical protein
LQNFVHALFTSPSTARRRRPRVNQPVFLQREREKERKKERKEKKIVISSRDARKVNIPTPSQRRETPHHWTTIKTPILDDTFGPRLLLSVLATLFAAVMFAFCASMPRSLCLELCSCL